jgi:hypothetical protein
VLGEIPLGFPWIPHEAHGSSIPSALRSSHPMTWGRRGQWRRRPGRRSWPLSRRLNWPRTTPSPAKTGEKQAARRCRSVIAHGNLSLKPRYSSGEFL